MSQKLTFIKGGQREYRQSQNCKMSGITGDLPDALGAQGRTPYQEVKLQPFSGKHRVVVGKMFALELVRNGF